MLKTQVGKLFRCPRCRFALDKQKLASINIYLKYTKMQGYLTPMIPIGI